MIAGILFVGGVVWVTISQITYGGDFVLKKKNGQWRFLEQSPKTLNLIYFGFTKCENVCPLTMSVAGSAFRELTANELENVSFLFVSVDSEHDTPERVSTYAAQFFPAFTGLTGTKAQIDKTIQLCPAGYILESNPTAPLGYTLTHTDKIFILNRHGILIETITTPRNKEDILNKIRKNL